MKAQSHPEKEDGMAEELKLNDPWLVAVWPGMGHVAISGGYYLMAKLGMHMLAEFSAEELFDVEHVEVKAGLIRAARLPRNRVFVWRDPRGRHDILVFIGEAQPPRGKLAFCRSLVDFAKRLGVRRVFTFAAMATAMHPEHDSRVFGAATDGHGLAELKRLELEPLEDGHIGGLNGVLLGIAAEAGLPGACLLGEMPHIFAQLPFPKASMAVLNAFTTIADIQIDFTELAQQAKEMERRLGDLLAQVEQTIQSHGEPDEEDEPSPYEASLTEEGQSSGDHDHIERLFAQARQDRSTAYELKRELDRLGLYHEFEDRFLDLFKKPE
jgi:proteasome assembly chaperone (PAC2) family protein